jgi:predicted transposase YbfD/YdcC
MPKPTHSIEQHFGNITDPRDGNLSHPLLSVITITILASLCDADGWTEVEMFGQSKRKWLETFLDLPHGTPSHDTFGRVFRVIDPVEFQESFRSWTQALCEKIEGVVAIDGKTVRRSKDGVLGKAALHMVNVWAVDNGLALAQEKVDDKTNEITVIPTLLELLDLEGSIVTLDAMGCQTNIAQAIRDQRADYVLAVKDNQPTLREEIADSFEHVPPKASIDHYRTVNKGHGRIEIRDCWVTADPELLTFINEYKAWPGLTSLVKVTSQRQLQGETSEETRYFISSLPADAQLLLRCVRAHWQIENNLHWVLDMAFREDESRVRKDHAPQNLAILRLLTLNLLKQDTSPKVGIQAKRKRAGWDHDYLLSLLCLP